MKVIVHVQDTIIKASRSHRSHPVRHWVVKVRINSHDKSNSQSKSRSKSRSKSTPTRVEQLPETVCKRLIEQQVQAGYAEPSYEISKVHIQCKMGKQRVASIVSFQGFELPEVVFRSKPIAGVSDAVQMISDTSLATRQLQPDDWNAAIHLFRITNPSFFSQP